ncbi:MAG: tRNA (adenosine(37)-N6)-threonylcarbamoyltransferase complex dimerization subunit type 1 TsaB [Candidatus Saccharibacteria bacterium]
MILTIHTTGMESEIGLVSVNGTVIAHQKWESGRGLSDELLGRITQLLEANNAALSHLTGVIIFSGPGSFTSLRIGHTIANALADGLGIPVVGVMGETWVEEGIVELKTSGVKEPALPFYGAEPNITKPKA